MSKTDIRRIISVIICVAVILVITGTGEAVAMTDDGGNELYFGALGEKEITKLVTADVVRGDFVISSAVKGQIVYKNTQAIFNTLDVGGTWFVRFTASRGDEVEKGDKIAEIAYEVDWLRVLKLKSDLETKKQQLESYTQNVKALLAEYAEKAEKSSGREKELARLAYDRLEISYNEEVAARESEIGQLKAEYDKFEKLESPMYITAPCSGIIGDLSRLRASQSLSYYQYVGSIFSTDEIVVYIEGGSDLLRYNMPVTVSQVRGSETVNVEGRVVSCRNNSLSPNLLGTNDYIAIEGDASVFSINKDITVRFESVRMEDALIIPTKAIDSDNKGKFVYVAADGMSSKRYIVCGPNNGSETWVVHGLDEGEKVVIR